MLQNNATTPRIAGLLSEAECQAILNKAVSAEVQLKDFQLQPALGAIGFLGDYYHLYMNYMQSENSNNNAVEKSLKLFVKALPLENTEHEKEIIFKKEAKLYGDLLKELTKFSPELWCAAAYYTRDDLLVLHDLHELGYDICHSTAESLTQAEMQPILRSLAMIHAASIAFEQHKILHIGTRYQEWLSEITVSPQVAWWTTGLNAVLAVAKQHPRYQSAEMQKFIEHELPSQLNRVYEMVNPSRKYCNVFCHRDAWRANVFYHKKDAAKAAVLVDYQTCRYAPACTDLLIAFFLNLEESELKLRETEYLVWYYQQFKAYLLQQGLEAKLYISEEALLHSYKEMQLFGYVYKALATTMLKVPKELVTNEYKYGNRAQLLIEYMKENATFCGYMEQCVEDVIKIVLQEVQRP